MLTHPLMLSLVYPILAGVILWILRPYIFRSNNVIANLNYSDTPVPPLLSKELDEYRKSNDQQIGDMYQKYIDLSNRLGQISITEIKKTSEVKDVEGNRAGGDTKAGVARIDTIRQKLDEMASEIQDCGERFHAQRRSLLMKRYELIKPHDFVGLHQELPQAAWSGSVENRRGSVAKRVRLEIPDGAIAVISRPGQQQECVRINKVVEVGDVQAREVVKVTVWLSWIGSAHDAKRIVVRHDDGTGRVITRLPANLRWIEVGEFLAFVWPIIIPFIIGLLLSVIISLGAIDSEEGRSSASNTSETEEAAE